MNRVSLSFSELMALASNLSLTVYYNQSDCGYDLYVYDYVYGDLYHNVAAYDKLNIAQNTNYNHFSTMITEGTTSVGRITNEDEILYYSRIAKTSPVVKKTSTVDLYTESLNYTTDFSDNVYIREVLCKSEFDIEAANNRVVSVKFDSKTGSTYDTVVASLTFSDLRNASWQPAGDFSLSSGDELNISCPNTGITMSTDLYVTVVGEIVR